MTITRKGLAGIEVTATLAIATDDQTFDCYDGMLGKHLRIVDGEVVEGSSLSVTKH